MRKSENIDCIIGTAVRFQTKLPQELVGRIDEQLFEKCIQTLNEIFAKAEKLTWKSFFENIIGCFTCYLSHLCMEYQFNPIERGLRMIEISILNNVNVTQSPAV
ncbi:Golgin subfamily A member [Trichinella pseudospiralis]